jgi:hypothetical protein
MLLRVRAEEADDRVFFTYTAIVPAMKNAGTRQARTQPRVFVKEGQACPDRLRHTGASMERSRRSERRRQAARTSPLFHEVAFMPAVISSLIFSTRHAALPDEFLIDHQAGVRNAYDAMPSRSVTFSTAALCVHLFQRFVSPLLKRAAVHASWSKYLYCHVHILRLLCFL